MFNEPYSREAVKWSLATQGRCSMIWQEAAELPAHSDAGQCRSLIVFPSAICKKLPSRNVFVNSCSEDGAGKGLHRLKSRQCMYISLSQAHADGRWETLHEDTCMEYSGFYDMESLVWGTLCQVLCVRKGIFYLYYCIDTVRHLSGSTWVPGTSLAKL